MNTVSRISLLLLLAFAMLVGSGFRKRSPVRYRSTADVRVASASSTFIDARFSYDGAGRLARMEMKDGRAYVFSYIGRHTVKVRFRQDPTFESPAFRYTHTMTSLDRSGRIRSSYTCSPEDTIRLQFGYGPAEKIRFELRDQGGVERVLSNVNGMDTFYTEPYHYRDSTVYLWKNGNLSIRRVYSHGILTSETFYDYEAKYSGRQHAPYNSGFSMLPSVTEISGLTYYGPYLSRNLMQKELTYVYGPEGDTLSMTSRAYGSIEVDASGRLAGYSVRQTDMAQGFVRSKRYDKFSMTYSGPLRKRSLK